MGRKENTDGIFRFVKSDSCKVSVNDEQQKFVSDREKIRKALKQENVMGFDIMHGEDIIGFAMLRQYEEKGYFLWNYLIDENCQHQGYGSKALRELIRLMTSEYRAENITTTCINGNDTALKMYQKAGFIITDVIDEDDIHETDLILKTEA
ncbi:MAG: GNAT family N-acetyltransferase [Erysipelotrichaceae bacterium]|nr:GNAT family N-acetyltransferase [Erysipelotrichaceae bacterium]